MNTIFAAVVLATATAAIATDANAYSLRLIRACSSDYYSHCSQHSLSSPALPQCFKAAGASLKMGCIKAMVADRLVSVAEVNRILGAAGRRASLD